MLKYLGIEENNICNLQMIQEKKIDKKVDIGVVYIGFFVLL